jgi:inner membrane protein YidH
MSDSAQNDPRVYFAAERTFLAWIRTGLGLMGVGFAVSRFGLFLREFMDRQAPSHAHTTRHSVVAGVALVVLGVIVNIAATVHHVQVTRQLASGSWETGHVSKNAVALAILLAVAGMAMAVYLLLVH